MLVIKPNELYLELPSSFSTFAPLVAYPITVATLVSLQKFTKLSADENVFSFTNK